MIETNELIKNCPCMMRGNDDTIICKKSKQRFNEEKSICNLNIIGIGNNGKVVAVCGYDWSIISISKDGIEYVGKHLEDITLRSVIDHPKILLKDAKVVTIKDIEKAFGGVPVILCDKNNLESF